jgi:hypothetical protein
MPLPTQFAIAPWAAPQALFVRPSVRYGRFRQEVRCNGARFFSGFFGKYFEFGIADYGASS